MLIQTKLQPPVIQTNSLPRQHLIDRLNNGRYHKLTLISAPAGSGKTVLASIWQAQVDCPVAWLSLDKKDNELATFLNYFIHAIQAVLPDAFSEILSWLDALQLPPLDLLINSLVSETSTFPTHLLFVLDDYHLISNQDIHQIIEAIIQYQSPYLHLAIVTRQDPPFDIIYLRAQDQVTEIRLDDLRFNEAETQQYLKTYLDPNISFDIAQKLSQYTEGWAVGLRLSILALRNQVDQAIFLATYQAQNKYIMSYLLNEVLAQQPQSVQTFLLYTSLFDRFCLPLCDALLLDSGIDSRETLTRIQQENLFLIALDYQDQWFRYHHLFQDLLGHHLSTIISQSEISRLHIQASDWFLEHDFIEEALDHAFQSGDIDCAIQVIAQVRYDLMNNAQWRRLRELVSQFSPDVIERSPILQIVEVWLHYHRGHYARLPHALARFAQTIDSYPLSLTETNYLLGETSALSGLLAYFNLDPTNAISYAQQSLQLTAPDLWIIRVFARMVLAGSQQFLGDLPGAYATIFDNFDSEPVQNKPLKATTLVTACNIAWMAADLHLLRQYASQILELCQQDCSLEMLGQGHYHLGAVAYLQNDLTVAQQHFSHVYQRPHTNYGGCYAHSAFGLALVYQTQGKEQAARDIVDTAHTFFLETGNTQYVIVTKAFEMELALRQGALNVAIQWADQMTPPPLVPAYRLYSPHITLVKIWLAENTPQSRSKATELLRQLKEFFEFTHNNIFLIQTLALQVICYQLHGNEAEALAQLEKALSLSVRLPGMILRPFVDLGLVMGNLLYKLRVDDPELVAYKAELLTAVAPLMQQSTLPKNNNGSQPLVDPLTDRELEVLALLGQRQTDKEIAATLQISYHTVRSHTKTIYQKLDVANRREAVTHAQEIGLLALN